MARKARSKVESLGVQKLVDDLLSANATYEEIQRAVADASGQDISDSALSRYRTKWSERLARLDVARQEIDAVAKVLESRQESGAPGVMDTITDLLKVKLLKPLADAEAEFDRSDLVDIARIVVSLQRTSQRDEALRIQRDRLELMKERVVAAAEKVEETGKAKGLDEETLKKIREEIYGIAQAAA